MEDGVGVEVLGRHDGLDHVLLEVLGDLLVGDVGRVLGRDEDGVDANGDHGAACGVSLIGEGEKKKRERKKQGEFSFSLLFHRRSRRSISKNEKKTPRKKINSPSFLYSTVTWVLPSGLSHGTVPFLRTSVSL